MIKYAKPQRDPRGHSLRGGVSWSDLAGKWRDGLPDCDVGKMISLAQRLEDLEDIGPHYARTLELWRHNFFAQLPKVRQLGYSEQFIRLWEFYLCYCEGGFAERQLGDVQMLLTKPDCRRAPVTGG